MRTAKNTVDCLHREDNCPTPETWQVDSIDYGKDRAYIYADRSYPKSACVAEVRCETIMNDELKANACVIAAAPDLLAACEATLDTLSVLTSEEYAQGDDSKLRDMLRAAIAKATVT